MTFNLQVYVFRTIQALLLCLLSATFAQAQGWVRNNGQVADEHGHPRPDVLFTHASPQFTTFVTESGFSYQFHRLSQPDSLARIGAYWMDYHRVDIEVLPVSIEKAKATTAGPLRTDRYYLSGDGMEAKAFSSVLVQYPGSGVRIDFRLRDNAPEYDLRVPNREALGQLRLRYTGHSSLKERNSTLVIGTRFGEAVERIPASFLCRGGHCEPCAVRVDVDWESATVAFAYDGPWPEGAHLLIDPMPQAMWATYAGGSGLDELHRVDTDSEGNIYVSGFTASPAGIATSGAHQGTLLGYQNCFLMKYDEHGTKLHGTYFGGAMGDRCYGQLFDEADGHIYLTGSSFSPGVASAGTHQTVLGSADDALLAKFDTDGKLIWATYYGGNGHDFMADAALGYAGRIVTTGHTRSTDAIATDGTSLPGFENGFIASFTPEGQLAWGTYFGGWFDEGWGVGTDTEGSIYVSGITGSATGIGTPGAHQPQPGGAMDAFLLKYAANGQKLWGTYLGGDSDDRSTKLCVLADGSVCMVGNTSSMTGIASPGAHQPMAGSTDDGFLARFASNGQRIYGTYVGGEGVEYLNAIRAVAGGLLIAGRSESQQGVTTPGGVLSTPAGEYDALVLRYSQEGAFEWGAYIGGPLSEYFNGVAPAPASGHVIAAGMTRSASGITLPGAQQEGYGGGLYDGFITRICAPQWPLAMHVSPEGMLCMGDEAIVSFSPSYPAHLWWDGSDAPTAAFSPPSAGTHALGLTVYDSFGCAMTDSVVAAADLCTNAPLPYPAPDQAPILYPNPTDGLLHIAWPRGGMRLRLYAADGRLVLEHQGNGPADLHHLPSGVYSLQLFDGENAKSWGARVVRE